jgi:hypothetical protein
MTDHEIRDALKVDPSPEYLARVRTRIATEPAPSPWRWSLTIAAAGAMAAALVVAVIVSRPAQPIEQRPGLVGPGTTAATEPAEPSALAGPKGPALQETPAPAARSAEAFAPQVVSGFSPTVPTKAEPEILLDPAETRALRALIAGVNDGRVDLAALQRDPSRAPMDLDPIAEIIIAPITIDAIAPLSGAEGERP